MASGLLLMSTNALSGSENAALSSRLTVRTVYISWVTGSFRDNAGQPLWYISITIERRLS